LKHNVLRIGLPVRQAEGDLLGYTCRAIDPEDAEPKYTPLAADRLSWREKELPARESLFLVDKVLDEGWDRLVIVEGPYDALKLYEAGIPAVAILGTNNWTDVKVSILIGLGLSAIVVMMDNDKSGWDAQPRIINSLKHSVKTIGLSLPASVKDPGGMSPRQLDWLKNKLDGL
jgi:DNA primase